MRKSIDWSAIAEYERWTRVTDDGIFPVFPITLDNIAGNNRFQNITWFIPERNTTNPDTDIKLPWR